MVVLKNITVFDAGGVVVEVLVRPVVVVVEGEVLVDRVGEVGHGFLERGGDGAVRLAVNLQSNMRYSLSTFFLVRYNIVITRAQFLGLIAVPFF